ncbi:unnamed protein product [Bartonella choladocola]|uniref:DUF7946 domain-containing protein n=1 Tax=Bartonella TaxID=773 RepID=UPI0018DE8372|nr:hypothetical protein [Bartonella choladocola]MBI0140560.1 hypothetical protein [Bartonella choladocola]
MELGISFTGDIANKNKLPAYEGIKSVEHISCSLLIISSFLVEGRIRRKKFQALPIEFNLVAQRKGSFEFLYEVILPTSASIAIELGETITAEFMIDFLKYIYQRLLGKKETVENKEISKLEERHSGDVNAIVDAVESSIRQAHNIVNNGVLNIQIFSGDSPRDNIINFDSRSKAYLNDYIEDKSPRVKLFSISSFNANEGTGRAFDLQEKRTIPFNVSNDFDEKSINFLIHSMHEYTKKRRLNQIVNSSIALKYTCIMDRAGRVKKLTIQKARKELNDLV